ncbi:hypothetical protein BABINDRAFT_131290 [Babjeviella inositovora NRRL Y-12698]|uniref:Uncharacterized protein n=1 Tax=Babjeviella inositovora NRRL Y-12698 TaxID=984486 RepID=A0A1E3QRC6_9ASCO|nr:uncharacterized protein BABINDRAFT_131290 [Babjeviella inositovora NRRL Y-12698]ODQ80266.1 hypothetical protein BABINDRAFT_131290 [Babjeviella inositovora NRRL Y-12698]
MVKVRGSSDSGIILHIREMLYLCTVLAILMSLVANTSVWPRAHLVVGWYVYYNILVCISNPCTFISSL